MNELSRLLIPTCPVADPNPEKEYFCMDGLYFVWVYPWWRCFHILDTEWQYRVLLLVLVIRPEEHFII